ncbi:MAG TPA: Zn-dependent hydrolase [Bacillota bacterium]|nr:Zn-dependent hydrolase [Bacillota bacterium]
MVNIERILTNLDELAQFNATPGQGITRLSFTPEDRRAREWFIAKAKDLGMKVRIDAAGNIFARLAGGSGPALLAGSHLDSVPNGGKLDGALGVVLALEMATQVVAERDNLKRPFEVVVWTDEEAAHFNTGPFGSRAATGQVPADELLTARSKDGVVLGDALREFASGDIASAKLDPNDYYGYLEVHIEQGARLIEEGYQVGIVEGVVGIARMEVNITGQANHAGTTPMNRRRDALYTAARIVLETRKLGLKYMPGVATVGSLRAFPGAVNVIPGEVQLFIEVRHLSADTVEDMVREAEGFVQALCVEEGLCATTRRIKGSQATLTSPIFTALLTSQANALGYENLALPSGAGHDAQHLARIMPIGMLFVPSIGGISHSPQEDSKPDDIAAAANVLLGAVRHVLGLNGTETACESDSR